MKSVGVRVHGWRWPVVWWARRKPRSRLRQTLWNAADAIDWRFRLLPSIRRARRDARPADIRSHPLEDCPVCQELGDWASCDDSMEWIEAHEALKALREIADT